MRNTSAWARIVVVIVLLLAVAFSPRYQSSHRNHVLMVMNQGMEMVLHGGNLIVVSAPTCDDVAVSRGEAMIEDGKSLIKSAQLADRQGEDSAARYVQDLAAAMLALAGDVEALCTAESPAVADTRILQANQALGMAVQGAQLIIIARIEQEIDQGVEDRGHGVLARARQQWEETVRTSPAHGARDAQLTHKMVDHQKKLLDLFSELPHVIYGKNLPRSSQ